MRIDLIGQRFGRWAVIERIPRTRSKNSQWRCRCDCGEQKDVLTNSLQRGQSTSCGCLTRVDVTGQRFGKLVVVGRAIEKTHDSKSLWHCMCDCGTSKVIRLSSLRHGGDNSTKSCGCLGTLPEGESAFNRLLRNYRRHAKRRKLSFDLDGGQFRHLINGACYYCGATPFRFAGDPLHDNGTYVYNGIDRIDNAVGYVAANCVSCCTECNRGKMTKTRVEFLDWIGRVHQHSLAGANFIPRATVGDPL